MNRVKQKPRHRLLVRAISVLILAMSVLCANLATDLVYAYVDPRIRHSR